jgi:polyketide cyclase/dehydrase/lipid transport protein
VIRIEREHRFEVPVEAGFSYITDTANWPAYWPNFVRLEEASQWSTPGDETRIVVRLLGRDIELHMKLSRFDDNQLVEYESAQRGAPAAHHQRHFVATEGGFLYRMVVEYEPRSGLRGFYDRVLLRRGVKRAIAQTIRNLEVKLAP